jgi:hypothetical protein
MIHHLKHQTLPQSCSDFFPASSFGRFSQIAQPWIYPGDGRELEWFVP